MNKLKKITEEDLTKEKTEVEDFKMTTSIDAIVGFVVMSFLTYYYYQLIDYPLFNKHETWLFWSLVAGWVIGVIIPTIFFIISYFYGKEIKKYETNKPID
jgi:uncharacterized PurR-regulated membrane protein YhhQ (DUF165 family)